MKNFIKQFIKRREERRALKEFFANAEPLKLKDLPEFQFGYHLGQVEAGHDYFVMLAIWCAFFVIASFLV